jgi:ankyrin repeat protein
VTQPRPHFVAIIADVDHEAIEAARSLVTPEDVPALAAWYHTILRWDQKLALVDLICDQDHPSMEAVLLDALRAPGQGDWVDLPKAFALGWLDESLDNFMGYYSDRALLHATVDDFLAARGMRREPEPRAPAKPSPPLPSEPTERLFAALAASRNDEVRRLLGEGASPDTVQNGDPALCWALMKGNAAGAMLLVDAGAKVNVARSTADQPALWWAASTGAPSVVRAMLAKGAAVDAQNKWGSTPLAVACTSGHTEVVRLLLEAGANVHNQISDGRTFINLAVRGGKAEILELLLDHGADLQSPQPSFTPLAFACFEGNAAQVKVLLDRGADPNARFTGTGFRNATALHVAARAGKVTMVQHLLAAGAKPFLSGYDGRTAADLARGRRADRIRELLAAEDGRAAT